MNAVAMFLHQMQIPVKRGESVIPQEEGEKHALFQSLIAKNLTEDMLENEKVKESKEKNIGMPVPSLFPAEIMVNLFTEDENKDGEVMQVYQQTLPNDALDKTMITEEMKELVLSVQNQSLIQIFQEVQTVLKQLNREPENMEKAAPKLLQLLQQWVKTANNSAEQKGMEKALTAFRQAETKEHIIWKDLVESFKKRHPLASNQQYSTSAAVSSEDIARWLSKAIEQKQVQDRLAVQQVYTTSALPLSRMEQYVVYVNQSQNVQAQGQQLTEQFQTIIKSSNFLTAPNKGQQLILSLRPANLGEMMVRFTQVNGEMTVKILVTTQAAKEMLETNMHQLRSMFSPQQVIVEKQDALMQQGQETEKSMKDDQLDEQKEKQSNDSSEEEKKQQEGDFAAQFEALLMNEEV
jgi:flagellar hook-length control protein FliK